MTRRLALTILLALSAIVSARAPTTFRVVAAEGDVRVQRAGGGWGDLHEGIQVAAEDIVQTGKDSRAHLRFGDVAALGVGADSKVLVSYAPNHKRKGTLRRLTLTVFSGAVFVEAAKPCSTSVYTTSAVAEVVGGAFVVVVDPAANETGVEAMAGDSVRVRNVADRRGRLLPPGRAAVVIPGSAPTVPRALNEGHVAVLSHFLGEAFVQSLMKQHQILPKPADAGGIEALPGGKDVALSPAARQVAPTSYGRLFSLDKIYASILNDRAERYRFYEPVTPSSPLFTDLFGLTLLGDAAIRTVQTRGLFMLGPWLQWKFMDAALRLDLGEDYAGWTLPQFRDGLKGALDIVDHVTVGYPRDSLFITLGPLRNYTIGSGIVVRRLDNRNPYSLYQPLALQGQASLFERLCLDGFIGDVSDFSYGGIRAFFQSLGYYAGLGYYYDADEVNALPQGPGNRFTAQVADSIPHTSAESAHIAELDLGLDIASTDAFSLTLSGALAYRFKTLTRSAGYAIEAPTLVAGWLGMRLGASYVAEFGRLTTEHFSSFYPTNRFRVVDVDSAAYGLTQNGMLSDSRKTQGFRVFYAVRPVAGFSVEADYRQDLSSHHVFESSAYHSSDNYEYYIQLSVDDTLIPFLHTATLSFGQAQGGLSPPDAPLSGTWGMRGDLHVVTKPLVANIAVEFGVEYYQIDLNANNRVDPSDRVVELYAGLRWGLR